MTLGLMCLAMVVTPAEGYMPVSPNSTMSRITRPESDTALPATPDFLRTGWEGVVRIDHSLALLLIPLVVKLTTRIQYL